MKKIKYLFCVIFIVLLNFINTFPQNDSIKNNCLLKANLFLKDSCFQSLSFYYYFYIKIENIGKEEIALPKYLILGYSDENQSEVFIELFVKNNKNGFNYYEVNDNNRIENLPYFESDTIIVRKYEEYEYQEDMRYLYILDPGIYKMRAVLRLQEYINCPEIKTNWVEFTVK